MLPAKDKEDQCKEEGRAAADRAGSAGRRWAAWASPRRAAEAGEHPGQCGAESGETGAPHPGSKPEVTSQAALTSRSQVTSPTSRSKHLSFLPLRCQRSVKHFHE